MSEIRRACGVSRVTITKGMQELRKRPLTAGRIRRLGGGRPALVRLDPELPRALEGLVEPVARGDPALPLRWTSKSTRALAAALTAGRHPVRHEKVAHRLRQLDSSLQSNQKTEAGDNHPDRDAQVRTALAHGQPVISVDTKTTALIGNDRHAGRTWRTAKSAQQGNGHDCPDPSVPRAYPYGLSALARNTGFVNVGTDHDTGAFAGASIRGWWRCEGRRLDPPVRTLVITADGGGSNGYRLRQWKMALQGLADRTGLSIRVCHFPPGTSKWNKVEPRLFSFISSNWRGEPLRDYDTVVRLIAGTTTATGLSVPCRLDRRRYPVGRNVSDEELASVNVTPDAFHGEWNYLIRPRTVQNL